MRIVIIAHNLRVAGGLPIGRNIVLNLPKIASMHHFLMIVPKGCGYPDFSAVDNVDVIECARVGVLNRLYLERRFLQKAIQDFRPDWIWALGNFCPVTPVAPMSLFVQDAHHVNYPFAVMKYPWHQIPWKFIKIKFINRKILWSLRLATRAYAQTETMRKRISEVYRYPSERIGLCPGSFSLPETRCKSGAFSQILSQWTDSFKLFYVSSCARHKNHETLLVTFDRFRNELSGVVCFLTFDENSGSREKELVQEIHRLKLGNSLIPLGTIHPEKISQYYRQMDAVIFPTLLETVGLAHLEAMFFDLPVIASDRDFAHEVCGDAAHFVEPLSPENVRDGILRLKNDPIYCEELIQRGRKRITRHTKTWPEIVRDVLDQEGIVHE